jgi:8-oxo-dGTP pyrophosphatase MutT (NUDIX family)
MIKPAAFHMKPMKQERVRVVLPYLEGYLLERLSNPRWPMNMGKTRHVGGGIENNETPEQAASRELFEELGVTIPPASFEKLGSHENQHYLIVKDHGLVPGVYKASVGSDEYIHLVAGDLKEAQYIGPRLETLTQPTQ